MLQLNPEHRADINQVLASPLFDVYKKPPFYFPLTPIQYNYMIESYIGNTKGVVHLHLPNEVHRIKTFNKDFRVTGKFSTEEAYTQCTNTFRSNLCMDTFTEEDIFSETELFEDGGMEQEKEDGTLYGYSIFPEKEKTRHEMDSLQDSFVPDEFSNFWNDVDSYEHFTFGHLQPETVALPKIVVLEFGEGSSRLNPRIISIKRKHSGGKEMETHFS